MANAMVEARNEGRTYRRVEVITGGRRRQNWTADEKARIITEKSRAGGKHLRSCKAQRCEPWASERLATTSARISDGSGGDVRGGSD